MSSSLISCISLISCMEISRLYNADPHEAYKTSVNLDWKKKLNKLKFEYKY